MVGRRGKRGGKRGGGRSKESCQNEGTWAEEGEQWERRAENVEWTSGESAAVAPRERAVQAYEEALKREDTSGLREALARALQALAGTGQKAAMGKALEEAKRREEQAERQAEELLGRAAEVAAGGGTPEVRVEEGNARARMGELLAGREDERAERELEAAVAAYEGSVAAGGEEDEAVLANMADVRRQRCELSKDPREGRRSDFLYSKAFSSCEDPPPSLLHDWGCALLAAADAMKRCGLRQEAADAIERAQRVFREASSQSPGSSEALVGVGEAVMALAELRGPGERLEAARRAQREGFGRALEVDSRCTDAAVGMAEAELAAAREGDAGAAERACDWYLRASREESWRIGGWRERGELAYNLACACSLAGSGRTEEGKAGLVAAVKSGAATAEEARSDPELQGLLASGDVPLSSYSAPPE